MLGLGEMRWREREAKWECVSGSVFVSFGIGGGAINTEMSSPPLCTLGYTGMFFVVKSPRAHCTTSRKCPDPSSCCSHIFKKELKVPKN